MPFVGWNRAMIERGAFFFGFSHTPLHSMQIPADTYTFTLFRDPVERVLSHYKMLLEEQAASEKHPSFFDEEPWLGSCFSDFVERMPREHLCNQLFMFSRNFSTSEALENIKRVTNVELFPDVGNLVEDINEEFGLALRSMHVRRATITFEPSKADRAKLESRLKDELDLFDKIVALARSGNMAVGARRLAA